jgi:hypothetical protein
MFGINRAIKHAFEQVTLGDLARGAFPAQSMETKFDFRPAREELQ